MHLALGLYVFSQKKKKKKIKIYKKKKKKKQSKIINTLETYHSPLGIVRDVEVLCGKIKYRTDFLVLGSPQDDFCPIIFGRPFLNTVNAKIDCEKETVSVSFGDVSHEFNFSKYRRQPHDKELPNKGEIIGLASIVVPPTNPL